MHKRTGCIGHHSALRGGCDFYSNRDDARDIASILAKSVLDHLEAREALQKYPLTRRRTTICPV